MSGRRNGPRTLWFRAKDYGWGWYPITWQGWAVTAFYTLAYAISLVLFLGWMASLETHYAGVQAEFLGYLEFVIWMALLTFSMIRICYAFGEKPEWRWAGKKIGSGKK